MNGTTAPGGAQHANQDAAASVDTATSLGELRELDTGAAPTPGSPAELIAHVVERFHAVHRTELPELIRLAARVEAVHRDHPAVPRGLREQLERMHDELLSHMAKEETILFPMLSAAEVPPMVLHPIARMRAEHDDHGRALQDLTRLAADFQVPDDACNTWRALMLGARKFHDDLTEHVHTENNILFPMFEST